MQSQTETNRTCTQEENNMKATSLTDLVKNIFETQRNSEESELFRLPNLTNLFDKYLT